MHRDAEFILEHLRFEAQLMFGIQVTYFGLHAVLYAGVLQAATKLGRVTIASVGVVLSMCIISQFYRHHSLVRKKKDALSGAGAIKEKTRFKSLFHKQDGKAKFENCTRGCVGESLWLLVLQIISLLSQPIGAIVYLLGFDRGGRAMKAIIPSGCNNKSLIYTSMYTLLIGLLVLAFAAK
jgi:hypothetical protein